MHTSLVASLERDAKVIRALVDARRALILLGGASIRFPGDPSDAPAAIGDFRPEVHGIHSALGLLGFDWSERFDTQDSHDRC
jgi:hypothetical protein